MFRVVITGEYNVMVNCEELSGTAEYLTLYMRCHLSRCRYNRVRQYVNLQYRGAACSNNAISIIRSVNTSRLG